MYSELAGIKPATSTWNGGIHISELQTQVPVKPVRLELTSSTEICSALPS